ncbi:MAG: hypothetical protein HYR94_06875 [Chloroflexi bacterium]|nr:hypothetical protein [Chloroflexota bacterium]
MTSVAVLWKILKIIGLGLLIWSLGLLWPEINLTLVLAATLAVALVLGSVALLAFWQQHMNQSSPPSPKQRHPTRPVAVH